MGDSPAVSVVMTAYNVAPYIGAAIQSALAQTFRDFELLVLDDGSTDGTLRIAEQFQDRRVRVLRSPHRGAAMQLRHGIEQTSGPYVALLDADDLWSPNKLEQHVRFLDAQPRADLTFSWSRIIDEDGRDTGLTSRLWDGPISFSELLADNVIGNGSALVFRREALVAAGGIDASLAACYDLDAWLRIGALRPGNLWAIPEFLTFYRRRHGQLTGDVPVIERSFEQLMQKARWFAPRAVALVEGRARSNMQRFCAYGWYQAGSYGRAFGTMTRSLRRAPRVFFADRRNWEMTAAALSGLLLPAGLHRRITGAALRARRA
ncbi:MAG TPA: glycosyltransferase [Bryobacteraceae bacterium]|nr:glycosyltransferase [Bryobacteraceae bacterium]